MGRKLAAKISAETDQMIDEVQTTNSQIPAQTKNSAPLFFTDTVGSTESRRETLRRKRDESEVAAKAALEEQLAQVARKRQKIDNRKKQFHLQHGPDPSHSNNQQPIADQIEVYDMWAPTIPAKELRSTKLGRKFRAHLNSSIIDAGTAMQASLPHPGQSFNPAPESHRELITKAIEMEKFQREEAAEIARKLNPEVVEPVKQEDEHSMTDDAAVKEEDFDSEDETYTGLVRLKPAVARMTTAQRNKQLRHQELIKAQAEAKKLRQLNKNIERMPNIIATLKNAQKHRDRLRKARVERNAKINPMAVTAPRLGPGLPKQVSRTIPDVTLSDELAKAKHHNMLELTRSHPLAVNAAFERLQQRRLIEPRKKQKVRRKFKLIETDRLRESKFEGQLDQYARKL